MLQYALVEVLSVKIVPFVLGLGTTLVAIAGASVCLPNFMWLKHSTLRINNDGSQPIDLAQIQVGDTLIEVKDVAPGAFAFRILPEQSVGRAVVTLPPNHSLEGLCHTYTEEKMYHIDVKIKNGKVLECESSVPLLSKLWLIKAFI